MHLVSMHATSFKVYMVEEIYVACFKRQRNKPRKNKLECFVYFFSLFFIFKKIEELCNLIFHDNSTV